jgi:hypothetical protein
MGKETEDTSSAAEDAKLEEEEYVGIAGEGQAIIDWD